MKIKIYCPWCERVDALSKANSVQFEYLSPFDNKIIDSFRTVEDLNKFRLNLFNLFKTKVKIWVAHEYDEWRWLIQWFTIYGDQIFDVSDNDLWRCLPFYVVKKFFKRSKIQHRYINNENLYFFDYI